MPTCFQNYDYRYKLKGKPVFAPSDSGRKVGKDIKKQVEDVYNFDGFFYHLMKGGHVSALHVHRQCNYFCKLDIKNFFYSISRNRISACLGLIGIAHRSQYARWSVVKNPFDNELNYVLPYGFIQSPILATLVMAESPLGTTLRQLPENVTATVYVDDILLSSNDLDILTDCYTAVRTAITDSNFQINERKSVPPINQISAFNCDMQQGITNVNQDRIDEFYSSAPSPYSIIGFQKYLESVRHGNP